MPAKFHSDIIIITSNLAASRFVGKTSYRLMNSPWVIPVYMDYIMDFTVQMPNDNSKRTDKHKYILE